MLLRFFNLFVFTSSGFIIKILGIALIIILQNFRLLNFVIGGYLIERGFLCVLKILFCLLIFKKNVFSLFDKMYGKFLPHSIPSFIFLLLILSDYLNRTSVIRIFIFLSLLFLALLDSVCFSPGFNHFINYLIIIWIKTLDCFPCSFGFRISFPID